MAKTADLWQDPIAPVIHAAADRLGLELRRLRLGPIGVAQPGDCWSPDDEIEDVCVSALIGVRKDRPGSVGLLVTEHTRLQIAYDPALCTSDPFCGADDLAALLNLVFRETVPENDRAFHELGEARSPAGFPFLGREGKLLIGAVAGERIDWSDFDGACVLCHDGYRWITTPESMERQHDRCSGLYPMTGTLPAGFASATRLVSNELNSDVPALTVGFDARGALVGTMIKLHMNDLEGGFWPLLLVVDGEAADQAAERANALWSMTDDFREAWHVFKADGPAVRMHEVYNRPGYADEVGDPLALDGPRLFLLQDSRGWQTFGLGLAPAPKDETDPAATEDEGDDVDWDQVAGLYRR